MDALIKLQQSVTARSLKDLVTLDHAGGSVTLVLDFSSSMKCNMANGRRRVDGLREAVRQIQAEAPTSMLAFSGREASFVTTISNLEPAGGTPLSLALRLAADNGCTRVIVVSDGRPNDPMDALAVGQRLGRCDTIYVGDGDGREFMRQLAERTGGVAFDGDLAQIKALVSMVVGLLGDGGAR